ncbi:MAG: hypothetical protein GF364_02715 [Candidatus Lokiarchaeota archaeon]|nr:hypothetical protein [Candidatus Lokiarchaeota archaeon]
MKKVRREELLDKIEAWVDSHSEVFNNIREDWEEYNIIKPVTDARQSFKCNHCGECCSYSVEVFPLDIIQWLDEHRYDIVCSIFPFVDESEDFYYGFPLQEDFFNKINEILNSSASKKEKNAYRKIKSSILTLNPGFDKTSNYCIFYNPKQKHHCVIHELRPYSCRAYPFELKNFTHVEIPDDINDKYGETEDKNEDEEPMCPNECFSDNNAKLPTECSDEDIFSVLMDKLNYLSFNVVEPYITEDIISILIKLYANQIRFRKKSSRKKNKKSQKQGKETNKGTKRKIKDSKIYKMSFGPKDSEKK